MGTGDSEDRYAEYQRLIKEYRERGHTPNTEEIEYLISLLGVDESERPVMTVGQGQAEVSREGTPLRSFGFANCNMYLIKNIDNGHCMMVHGSFQKEDNPDRPVGVYGLPSHIMDEVEPFMQEDGRKLGISLYRPWQYKALENHHGGDNDFGVNRYFEEQGVKMRRCAIPYYKFEANQRIRAHKNMDERQFYTFDVEYEPKDDTLSVDAHVREHKDAEYEKVNLATLHPFKHPHLFEKSGFAREQS
ncbi:MAG: hypothetical protein MRY32_03735 [Rickettsiales bacterium]|nr:hypothetical protein [Rickettsiales bacterium]